MKMDVRSLTKMALVTALYVVLTVVFAPISYGAIQVRLSEMLVFLVLLDKRYIYALTLGCFIANIYSTLGPIDMVVGTLSTFVFLELMYYLTRNIKSLISKLVVSVVILVVSMIPITLELYYVLKVPFFVTLWTTALGEFISVSIGAIIFYIVMKYRKTIRG